MPEKAVDPDLVLIQKAIDLLSEHFDSVQIFANRYESGEKNGTIHVDLGYGNWYSRYGQVRDWLILKDEETREEVRNAEEGDD